MKKILFTALFIQLALPSEIKAQAYLDIQLVSFPDTVIEYMPNTAEIKIINTGNVAYNGPLVIYMADSVDFFPTDIYNETNISIPAVDSIIINIGNIIFFNPFFKYGNNIVVVWPQSAGTNNDSIITNVFMKNFTGIENDISLTNQIQVLPNPFTEKFHLKIPGLVYTNKDIVLRDVLGRTLPIDVSGNEVYILDNTTGLMLLEINLSDGSKVYRKLICY